MTRYGRNRPRQQQPRWRLDRLTVLLILLFGFSSILVVRLFTLQVLAHGFYEALASGQHEIEQRLLPDRGEIYAHDRYSDGQLFPLATNEERFLVYAVPKRIEDPEDVTEKLESFITLDKETLLARLSKSDDVYEPIEHNISVATKEKIEALEIDGISFISEKGRLYPEGSLASQILGFLGMSEDVKKGQYGLEGYFDEELAGQQGYLQAERDAAGRWITVGDRFIQDAKDGDDLILTIDRTLEYTVCTKLQEAVLKHGAESGAVVILDPDSGAILAMCGYPDFDPNHYNEVTDLDVFLNPAISPYEPGSIFKPITMATAVDTGKVTPETTYVDEGSVEVGGFTIRNSDDKTYGTQTMTEVLEKSLNTGAIFAAQQAGNDVFYDYVKRFGFGEQTGVELGNESAGNLGELASGRDIYVDTASFGQGITATPLQLAAAYAAIANGGTLYKPYIVDEIVKPNDFHVKTHPTAVRQVLDPKTSTTVSAMLVNVVKNGHGTRAAVPGYYIAGKTGTAQIPRTDGPGYDPNRTIGSFAGFGPVEDPKFVMVTKIVDPKDVKFAESTAAPLFGDIAKFLLNYFEVPPSVVGE